MIFRVRLTTVARVHTRATISVLTYLLKIRTRSKYARMERRARIYYIFIEHENRELIVEVYNSFSEVVYNPDEIFLKGSIVDEEFSNETLSDYALRITFIRKYSNSVIL